MRMHREVSLKRFRAQRHTSVRNKIPKSTAVWPMVLRYSQVDKRNLKRAKILAPSFPAQPVESNLFRE